MFEITGENIMFKNYIHKYYGQCRKYYGNIPVDLFNIEYPKYTILKHIKQIPNYMELYGKVDIIGNILLIYVYINKVGNYLLYDTNNKELYYIDISININNCILKCIIYNKKYVIITDIYYYDGKNISNELLNIRHKYLLDLIITSNTYIIDIPDIIEYKYIRSYIIDYIKLVPYNKIITKFIINDKYIILNKLLNE